MAGNICKGRKLLAGKDTRTIDPSARTANLIPRFPEHTNDAHEQLAEVVSEIEVGTAWRYQGLLYARPFLTDGFLPLKSCYPSTVSYHSYCRDGCDGPCLRIYVGSIGLIVGGAYLSIVVNYSILKRRK